MLITIPTSLIAQNGRSLPLIQNYPFGSLTHKLVYPVCIFMVEDVRVWREARGLPCYL